VKEFLKLGIPGLISNSEWWFFEIVQFLAGVWGSSSLAGKILYL